MLSRGRNCHFVDGHIDTFFENLKAKRIFRRQISRWQNLNILAVNIQILNIQTPNTHDPIVPAPIVANHEHDPNILMITLNRLSNRIFRTYSKLEILTLHIPNTIILFQINSWSLIFRFISTGQWISPIIAVLHDFNPIQWRPIHLLGHYHEAVESFARDEQLDPIELKIGVRFEKVWFGWGKLRLD